MIRTAQNSFAYQKWLVLGLLMVALVFLSGCEGLRSDARSQAEWIQSALNCWPCVIYKTAFSAVNTVVIKLHPVLSAKAILLLGVGLLFWLAFTTGKMITSLHEPDVKKYMQTVMLVLFKAILVVSVLSVPQYFLCFVDMIVSPVLTFFTHLSRIAITANTNINNGITWPNDYKDVQDTACNVFSSQVQYQLQDIIFRVYLALGGGVKLGFTLMMQVNLVNWILGPIIMWFFFMMMVLFPWIFVDSFIRLGSVIVLAPFFLVAWVFPATKDKIKTAWTTLSGAAMQLLIGCIYIGLVIGVIKAFEAQNWPGMMGDARQGADPDMMAKIRRLSVEAISFFALLLIMNKMQKNIPSISGALGGDSAQSDIVGFMDGVKKLTISVLQIALGAAMTAFGIPGGTQMIKAGTQKVAEQAKETIKEAAAETMDTGGGTGSGGGGEGGSAAAEIKRFKDAGKGGGDKGGGDKGDDKGEEKKESGDKDGGDKGGDK